MMKTDKKTEPATHVDEVDALRLENKLLKAQAAKAQFDALVADYNAAMVEVGKRFGFDPATESVDFATGKITRAT